MASSTPNAIFLNNNPARIMDESQAGGTAITPGMLCEFGASNLDDIIPHATAEGAAQPIFACPNQLGTPVSGTAAIDVAYGTAENVYYAVAQPGDIVYGFVTTSGTVAQGDYLVSAGNGYLQAQGTATAGATVAVALEAVTAGTAGPARIKVQVS